MRTASHDTRRRLRAAIDDLSQNDMIGQCNPVTNRRRASGRRRMPVDHSGLTEPPTDTMLILARMKNEGHSWRSLADEINTNMGEERRVSHELVRRVALGQCKSPRIDYALGTGPDPMPIFPCPDCGRYHKQAKTCKPKPPPKGKVRFSVWVTEDERDQLRAAADCHPDGRAVWLMENVRR